MIITQKIVQKTMVKHKGTDFTREEQLLLQDFSQNVSTKSSALFYGNAFIISAIPGGYGNLSRSCSIATLLFSMLAVLID